jgi:nitroreductase
MDFMHVIHKRRSARSFLPDPIPNEIIRDLIEAARLAPSGGNGQSWFFGVVEDDAIKKELAKAAGEQSWIATAPVIIACCSKLEEDMAGLPDDDFGLRVNKTRFGEEFVSYMNAFSDRRMASIFWANAVPLIPGEHIFLSAVNHGLSSCWVGYLDVRKASEILNLPEDSACLFLLPIGYANEEPEDIDRKSYEEIVFYNRIGAAHMDDNVLKVEGDSNNV